MTCSVVCFNWEMYLVCVGVPLTTSGLLSKTLSTGLAPAAMLHPHQAAAAAAMFPSQVLGVSSSMLPGQAGLVPTQPSARSTTTSRFAKSIMY